MIARSSTRAVPVLAVLLGALLLSAVPSSAASPHPDTVRVATFNASLNRSAAGQLITDLSTPTNAQAKAVAAIIQRARPDILLINEFDFDADSVAADLFRTNYLEVSQDGAEPISYPYAFSAPSNTGIPSGFDLNNNGTVGGPDDALGFGFYPGQFGMLVLSRYPILEDDIRTFQHFLWRDMPGALLPPDWYSAEELAVLPLSSKSHWDVPVRVGNRTVHVLAAHPTPPVFDGPEDRNGRRNFDEIRLWADYIAGGRTARYLVDDEGRRGGLPAGHAFVIVGDYNSDPLDGDSIPGSIQQLTEAPQIDVSFTPESAGAVQQAALQGGANASHESPHRFDTADFQDVPGPGNLRADYVLPSRRHLDILDGAVFWPLNSEPDFAYVGTFPFPSSDHRLVWLDLAV